MSTITRERTVHTGCPVEDRGNGYGYCSTHLVKVYRDGHDWHLFQTFTGDTIAVLSQQWGGTVRHVTVTAPESADDTLLAEVAGYHSRHHAAFSVSRHVDGTATVSLWNH
jgi:hypothetical protein